jgi:hypothetical protein
MSLIGVLCSDEEINNIISEEFEKGDRSAYILHFPSTEQEIMEFLNFDLPEIVIINFSDTSIDLEPIIEQIKTDSWLHNFGIVGIYNREEQKEETLHQKLKNLNVLALLDKQRLRSHIYKSVQIIDGNRQIIFHRDLSEKLVDNLTGSFVIDNDIMAVSVYAGIAATILSQRGYINPDAKMHLQLCLAELIVNGVEHGNCGITFEEKSEGLEQGTSVVELVEEKCQTPEVARKRVYMEWEISDDVTKFVIKDEGEGFDVTRLKEKIEKEGPFSLHGRGIRMARMFAHKLYYNTKGNKVIILIKHQNQEARTTPEGFSSEEVLYTKSGDVIFNEGEGSDFLYYISSGTYNVYHNDRIVGKLGPEDIFMGEMSFLLNNRRSAAVKAESEGRLVKISRRSFISVVKDYPHYGIFLSKLIARKLVRANTRNATEEAISSSL